MSVKFVDGDVWILIKWYQESTKISDNFLELKFLVNSKKLNFGACWREHGAFDTLQHFKNYEFSPDIFILKSLEFSDIFSPTSI